MRERLTRLRAWWNEPVIFNRLFMFLWYVVCAAVGFTTLRTTNPTLLKVTGDVYTAWWGGLMLVCGLVCAATVFSKRLEVFERSAAIFLTALLVSFLVAVVELMQTDMYDRENYATIALGFTLVTLFRTVWLIARSGRRRGE